MAFGGALESVVVRVQQSTEAAVIEAGGQEHHVTLRLRAIIWKPPTDSSGDFDVRGPRPDLL